MREFALEDGEPYVAQLESSARYLNNPVLEACCDSQLCLNCQGQIRSLFQADAAQCLLTTSKSNDTLLMEATGSYSEH